MGKSNISSGYGVANSNGYAAIRSYKTQLKLVLYFIFFLQMGFFYETYHRFVYVLHPMMNIVGMAKIEGGAER